MLLRQEGIFPERKVYCKNDAIARTPMISLAQERSHLLAADSHLLECRAHIRRQIEVVRHQRSMGWDDQASLELLRPEVNSAQHAGPPRHHPLSNRPENPVTMIAGPASGRGGRPQASGA